MHESKSGKKCKKSKDPSDIKNTHYYYCLLMRLHPGCLYDSLEVKSSDL